VGDRRGKAGQGGARRDLTWLGGASRGLAMARRGLAGLGGGLGGAWRG
jgi:hypothetical protein